MADKNPNKVVFGAVAIMDISDSTVTPETLAAGETAYDKAGNKITGTMVQKSDPVVQPLTVTENGTYTALDGVDGYNPVTVNVAGGGGGVETCTVMIGCRGINIYRVSATVFTNENGIEQNIIMGGVTFGTNIQNAVCGTIIHIYTTTPIVAGFTCTDGVELLSTAAMNRGEWFFMLPNRVSGDIAITVLDND